MQKERSETTRYLCAAVQLDEQFCDRVLKEIFHERYRVLGISHGVDLPMVVRNCLISKERRRKRDQKLALLLAITLLLIWLWQLWIIFYLIAWAIVFLEAKDARYNVVAKKLLRSNFGSSFFEEQLDPASERRLKEIGEEQSANVIIYGDFSPFVGSGKNIGGWSFAANIGKGKESVGKRLEPIPFQVSELYDYLSESVNSLQIPNLHIGDALYINGQEIRGQARFLINPLASPTVVAEPNLIDHYREHPTHAIRHYRHLRVSDWHGELIFSIFLRFAIIGQNLFIEANYCLLTPLRKYYRQYDHIHLEPNLRELLQLAGQTALKTFVVWFTSPWSVLKEWLKPWRKRRHRRKERREMAMNPTFNYGAINSLRERVSQQDYRQYFQKLDQEMYLKVLERQLVDGIVNFLDTKQIDTSDLQRTRSTILNHGVIVTGGSIQAQSIAVGEQAKSIVSNVTNAIKDTQAESSN